MSRIITQDITKRVRSAIVWSQISYCISTMSTSKRKSVKKAPEISSSDKCEEASSASTFATLDKSKNILIRILAKPGAKQNKIIDVTAEGLGVQINAPPTEGEANMELIKYMSSVIGVRKTDINLERGFKSRQKVLKICGSATTIDELQKRIAKEIEDA